MTASPPPTPEFHISGKAGARLNPLIAWLAETAAGAMTKTLAALEIAAQAAMGVDSDAN